MIDACPCPDCGNPMRATQRRRRKCPTCGVPLYSLQSHGVFASPYLSAEQRRLVQLAKRIDGFCPRLIVPWDVSTIDVQRAAIGSADPWPTLRFAVDGGREPLSALRDYCETFQRTIPEQFMPRWLWLMAYMPWNDPLTTRREARRVELRRVQREQVLCAPRPS
jgi:hypothetical protein